MLTLSKTSFPFELAWPHFLTKMQQRFQLEGIVVVLQARLVGDTLLQELMPMFWLQEAVVAKYFSAYLVTLRLYAA